MIIMLIVIITIIFIIFIIITMIYITTNAILPPHLYDPIFTLRDTKILEESSKVKDS